MRFHAGCVLLGILAVSGRAHAQELAAHQPVASLNDLLETRPPGEWPSAERGRFSGTIDQDLDAGQLHDALSVPRWIDGAIVSRQDEARDPDPTAPSLIRVGPHPHAQTPDNGAATPQTGLKSILSDTARDFNAFPRRTSTWVILSIGGAAAAIAHPVDAEVTEHLAGDESAARFFGAGKWIGSAYVQAGAAFGAYVVGRYMLPHEDAESKGRKASHLGLDMLRALIVSQALTQGIKITVQRDRPTGECCAFPSGHASATFATAAVLERHLGYRRTWPMFAVATYVATSRLYDNRHFLSDVLFGGALGIASGWTVAGRHGRSSYAVTPVAVPGGVMVRFSRNASSLSD